MEERAQMGGSSARGREQEKMLHYSYWDVLEIKMSDDPMLELNHIR